MTQFCISVLFIHYVYVCLCINFMCVSKFPNSVILLIYLNPI